MLQGRAARPERARSLRADPTEMERRLWFRLRLRRLGDFRFRRQVPLRPFIVDFACIEEKLIIEVDGGLHSDAAGYDARRTKWLNEHGWRVLRFWNNDVSENLDGVLERILQELEAAAASPLPALPRKRGRGKEERA